MVDKDAKGKWRFYQVLFPTIVDPVTISAWFEARVAKVGFGFKMSSWKF